MAVHVSQPAFVPYAAMPLALPYGPNIDDQVRRQIQNSPYPQLRSINCRNVGGKLTIRGTVSSYFLKQAAQEVLLHLPGVDRIDNRLVVSGI